MEKNQFFVDSAELSEKVLEKKRRLERDPSSRKNHMEYMDGMDLFGHYGSGTWPDAQL